MKQRIYYVIQIDLIRVKTDTGSTLHQNRKAETLQHGIGDESAEPTIAVFEWMNLFEIVIAYAAA